MTDRGRRSVKGYTLVELMVAMAITLFVMAGIYGLMIQNQRIYEQQSRLADVQQTARVALDLMTREIRMAGSDPSFKAFTKRSSCEQTTPYYKWPADARTPVPDDVAPLTVVTSTKIRVKMDRPSWTLPLEPVGVNLNPNTDLATADGDYDEDDEGGLGDSFIDDPGEDITFEYLASAKQLTRKETLSLVPAAACRATGSRAPGTDSTQVIADHVVDFQIKYYDHDPPQAACPAPANYADQAAYETAKDACDVPMATIPDITAVRRVRLRITVETDKVDSLAPKVAPKFGRMWITLASETTLRNR